MVWEYCRRSFLFTLILLFQTVSTAHARDLYEACLHQRANATHHGVFLDGLRPKRCCICVTAPRFDSKYLCRDLRNSSCEAYAEIPYSGSFSASPYPDGQEFRGCTSMNIEIYRHGSPEAGALIRQATGAACTYGAIETSVRDKGCSTFGDPRDVERFLSDPVDNRALLLSDQKLTVTANQTTVLYDVALLNKKGFAPLTQSPLTVRLNSTGYKILRHRCEDFGKECGADSEVATCEDKVELGGKTYKFGLDLICCANGHRWNGDPYFNWVRDTRCTSH